MGDRGKAVKKRGRSPAGRRVLALALSLAVACGSAPAGGAFAWGAEGDSGSLNGLEDLGQAYLAESGSGGSAGTEGLLSDEIALFQSADGADLRTYAAQADWYLGVTGMEAKETLYTVKSTIGYNGQVTEEEFTDTPSAEGMCFVIVGVALTKTVTGGADFAADEMTLEVGGYTADRVLNDGFLTDHDYKAFSNTAISAGSREGHVVFEVPTEYMAAIADWQTGMAENTIFLRAGDVLGTEARVDEDKRTEVPLGGYKVEEQFKREKDILTEYQATGGTISEPYFVLDPYGTAPLAGVALFHTEQPADTIRVTVEGKSADGKKTGVDITYEIETSGTEHQVPVFGFYPNYQNSFSMTALQAGQETEKGQAVSDARTNTVNANGYIQPALLDLESGNAASIAPGLTLLMNTEYTIVDEKAEVRWYMRPRITKSWGINELTERGTFYISDEGGLANPNVPEIIYEMNFTGKVIAQYLYVDDPSVCIPDTHHDATEIPGTDSLLYLVNSNMTNVGFKEVDRNTGAVVRFTRLTDFMNKIGTASDWAHINTIKPTADGCFLMSLRNQSLLLKYDYANNKVLWAMSQYKNSILNDNPDWKDIFVDLQADADQNGGQAEYTKQQHHVSELPDLDGNPDTEDILVFDNGDGRAGNYSRIVHYRIDLSTPGSFKAYQIYSAGKGQANFYGAIWGSAQYLTGADGTAHYMGGASSDRVMEFDETAKAVWGIKVGNPVGNGTGPDTYRSFRKETDYFVKGFHALGTLKGRAFMRVGQETPFVKMQLGEDVQGGVTGSISEIYGSGNQLILSGSARGAQASANKSVYLVADDNKNQYCAPLISSASTDQFNNMGKTARPISAASLPRGTYRLGLLVVESDGTRRYKEEPYYLEKRGAMEVVQTNDGQQQEIVEDLLAKAQNTENTLTNPVIQVNPFGTAPLSAVAAFYTPKGSEVKVTVQGKPASGETVQADVTYTVSGKTKNHVIPIVGLFANYTNTVVLEAGGKTAVVRVKVGEISRSLVREAKVEATAAQRSQTAQGLTFITPAGEQTVPYAIDVNGELRWAYLCAAAAPVETKPLRNGHFLIPSDRHGVGSFTTDAETVYEVDLAGRIYAEYFLEGQVHHEAFERENGNLVFALSRRNATSMEDFMAEVDRETGKTFRTWDFRKILGIPEYDPSYDPEQNGFDMTVDDPNAPHRAQPNIYISRGNHAYSDWFHQNSLYYDEGDPDDPRDDAIYVTARHQSALIKVNAQKAEGESPQADAVEWIYTDPSWLPQSTTLDWNSLLLKPENAAEAERVLEFLDVEEPTAEPEEEEGTEDPEEEAYSEAAISGGGEAGPDGGAAVEETSSGGAVEPSEPEESPTEPEAESILESGLSGSLETDVSGGATAVAEGGVIEGAVTEGAVTEGAAPSGEGVSDGADRAAAEGSVTEHLYAYGEHAVERLENGDLILYDNNLYGGKTTEPPAIDAANPSSMIWEQLQGLYSRAIRLRVDDEAKTFRIVWEYGEELGPSHYTPFIGDVDYLGGPGGTEDHYLVNFGGITKLNGMACDTMVAMTVPGAVLTADVREVIGSGDHKTVLWSAVLGWDGKASPSYRAERVNLEEVRFSAEDYETYTAIENKGLYRNTPQAHVEESVLSRAGRGTAPVSWQMLTDEGNRLLGKFTLPDNLMKSVENIYVVLDLDKSVSADADRRIYKASYVPALAALKTEAYYGFEIMKDNKPAQLQLLLERKDGSWILSDTGEVASASMRYVTGELPVIDVPPAVASVMKSDSAAILQQIADQQPDGTAGTLLFLSKGTLEPGKMFVYEDPRSGAQSSLVCSGAHEGYLALLDGQELDQAEASASVKVTEGRAPELRSGVVAANRYESKNGRLRTALAPEDIFYFSNQWEKGLLPYRDVQRTLALDVNGDYMIDIQDLYKLMEKYVSQ